MPTSRDHAVSHLDRREGVPGGTHPSGFVMSANPARRRYDRKSLLKKAGRQPRANLEDARDGWPLSALWIAAYDPQEGISDIPE